MIIIVPLLTGLAAAGVIYLITLRVQQWKIEKKFKDGLAAASSLFAGGVIGNTVFLAEKIGARLLALKIKGTETLVKEIGDAAAVLGEPYHRVPLPAFLGFQALASLGTMTVLLVVLGIGHSPLILLLAAGAFLLPLLYLRDKVKAKQRAVVRQLPDVLDLMTLLVQAGLDYPSAMNRIIEHEKGPLITELADMQREVRLGKPRADALRDMAERLRTPALHTVAGAVALALTTGSGMAQSLRRTAEQLREERVRQAEKTAGEAPIRLMLPLAFLIFPTVFIILFGPLLLSFIAAK